MRIGGYLVLLVSMMACNANHEESVAHIDEGIGIATFNTGLSRGYVDHAALRFEEQVLALSNLGDIDVLCLQEVWLPSDRNAIIEQLAPVFPYSHYENTTNESLFPNAEAEPAACTAEEAQPLADCASPTCEGDPDIATCVLSECGALFDALSAACQECAASNIGLDSVDAILETCLMEGSVGYTYNGQNGLLILSNAPIEAPSFRQFDSFLTSRGVLMGTTHGVDIACTHLTSRLAEPIYSGEYESYEAENAAQIDALISVFEERSMSSGQVLAGDFNTGPMAGDLTAELPENFNKFAARGWQNANTESSTPLCTWCSENLITSGTANEAIDHVFVRGLESDQPRRILDDSIIVTTAEGDDVTTSYSDHFGLSVRIRVSDEQP